MGQPGTQPGVTELLLFITAIPIMKLFARQRDEAADDTTPEVTKHHRWIAKGSNWDPG
jgi:hypothetical protein